MRELVDLHSHTVYSGHGEGSVDDVVRAARERRLSTIALTEHMHLPIEMDPTREFSMSVEEERAYEEEIARAQETYDDIEIVHGIEVDYFPGFESNLAAHRGVATYLLGSVHMIDGWAFDHPGLVHEWDERGIDDVWRQYFDLWVDAVHSGVGFFSMAHPDLVKKFGFMPSFDLSSFYDDLMQRIEGVDVALEISTAGLRKPVGAIYPSLDFVKAAHAAGFPITVASDSHSPSEVGYRIEDAYAHAYEVGYREILVPTRDGDRRIVGI